MASGTLPPASQPAEPPPKAPPTPQEVLIERRLRQTRRQVKTVDIAVAVLVLMAGGLVYLLIAALVDHWLIPGGLGSVGRGLLFAGLIVAAVVYFWWQILPLVVHRVNPVFAARVIEESHPSFKNGLVNLLFLRLERERVERSELARRVMQGLERNAAEELEKVPIEGTVDRGGIIRTGYLLAAIVILCALYLVISPKNLFTSFGRVVLPWADIKPPTRVTIESIRPGDEFAYQGDTVTVSAAVNGLRDDEEVLLYYTTADQQSVDQAIPMTVPERDYRYACELPPGRDGLQQEVAYYLRAGDCRSPTFTIEVGIPPEIVVEEVFYDYPDYTGLTDRVDRRTGDLVGIEGTRATIRATANFPVARAAMEMNGDARLARNMDAEGARATGKLTLRMSPEDPTQPEYRSYQIRFADPEGRENRRPIRHRIQVIPDLPPEVVFVDPPPERVRIPADGFLDLSVRAEDPDFALRRVLLRAQRDGRPLPIRPMLDQPPPDAAHEGEFEASHRFQPGELGLKPGDEVVYWAEAEDNKEDADGPAPNRAVTSRRWIEILSSEAGDPAEERPGDSAGEQAASPQGEPGEPPQENADEQREDGQRPPEQEPDAPEMQAEPKGDEQQEPPGEDRQASGEQPEEQDEQQQGEAGESPSGQQTGESSSPDQGQEGGPQQDGDQQPGQQGKDSPRGTEPGQPPQDGADAPQGAGEQPAGRQGEPGGQTGEPRTSSSPGGSGDSSDQAAEPINPDTDPGEAIQRILKHRAEEQSQDEQPGGQEAEPQEKQGDARPERSQDTGSPQGQGTPQPDSGSPPEGETGAEQQPSGGQPAGGQPSGAERPSGQPPSGQPPSDQQSGGRQPDGGAQQQPSGGDPAAEQADRPSGREEPAGEPSAGDGRQEPTETSPAGPEDGSPQGQGRTPGPQPDVSPQPSGEEPREESGDSASRPQGESGAGRSSGEPSGSPAPQESNAPREKRQGSPPGQGESETGQSAQSPSHSPRQSDSQSDTPGDKSGGGEEGGGQKADRPGQGSPGANSPADQGGETSNQQGPGEVGPGGGDQTVADRPTGRPASEGEGPGSTTKEQPGGDRPAEMPQSPQGPRDSGEPAAPNQPSGSPGQSGDSRTGTSPGQGNPTTGGAPGESQRPGTGAQPPQPPYGDEGNVEYARKQTDLALEHLEDQLAKEDSDVLDDLGWSRQDAERFLKKWRELQRTAGRDGEEGQEAKRQLDEAIRGLGLRPGGTGLENPKVRDQLRNIRDARRFEPPPEWAELVNEYKKSIASGDR